MKKFLALILCALMAVSSVALTSCNDDKADDDAATTTAAEGENAGENAGDAAAEKTVKDVPCKDIVAALETAFAGDIPEAGKLAFPVDDEYSDNYMDPDNINYVWTGNWDTMAEYEFIEDFAIRQPAGKSAFELHIVKVKDAANIDAVKALMEQRVTQLQNSDIKLYVTDGSYEKQMENVSTFVAGNYICLTVTTDKAKAESTIGSVIFE